MNTASCTILAAACLLLPAAVAAEQKAMAETAPGAAVSRDEALIRAEREHFNEAFESKDLEAIDTFFAPEYHIVTGRSEQAHGGAGEKAFFQQRFTDDPTFVCRRTPDQVHVNAGWGLAEELGGWSCDYTAEAEPVHSSGVYAAKWQRSQRGQWLLLTEVFTTLQCEGNDSGCQPPDPID